MAQRGRGRAPLSARPSRSTPPKEDDQPDGSDEAINSVEANLHEPVIPHTAHDLIAYHLTPAIDNAIRRQPSNTPLDPSARTAVCQAATRNPTFG